MNIIQRIKSQSRGAKRRRNIKRLEVLCSAVQEIVSDKSVRFPHKQARISQEFFKAMRAME